MAILVTGATGFVGAAFLVRLIAAPSTAPEHVYAILRGDPDLAADRLEKALSRALNAAGRTDVTAEQLLAQITIVQGDVFQPMFGLSMPDLEKLCSAGIDEIWAIASTLKPESWQQNVNSAKALIAIVGRLGATQVHYLSTAYVTGRDINEIHADTALGLVSEFNNDYERGKYLAERCLIEALSGTDIRLSLLRPTIIVGSRDTKLPGGSRSGLYGLVQVLLCEAARKAKSGDSTPLVVPFGHGEVNLVGIDYVIDEMLTARDRLAAARAGSLNQRFISGSDVPVDLIVAALSERIEINIQRAEDGTDQNRFSRHLNDSLSFFLPYSFVDNRKRFRNTNIAEADRIYEIDLINLIEASRNELVNDPLMDRMRASHITRPRQKPIVVYSSGDYDPDRKTVVIVNAFGMPVNVMHPLIVRLSDKGMNIITWDCRGLPDQGFDVTQSGLAIADHYADWEQIRDAFGLDGCMLLGWSTGAVVASYIANCEPKRILRLCLLNGSFMQPGATLTDFQKNLKSIMPKVALSRSLASTLFKAVFYKDRSRFVQLLTKDIARKAEAAMNVTDPAHTHLVQLLTAGPEEVFRYARLIRSFIKENPMKWLGSIRVPTLIISGEADITAHPQGSRDAHAAIPRSTLIMDPRGNHFSLYSSEAFIETTACFACNIPYQNRKIV